MAAWKLPRPYASPAYTDLPCELLLEIVARSDTRTVFRCAAACKLLRRDILAPSFIRRVTQTQQGAGFVPSRILARLNVHDDDDNDSPLPPPLSLVHPATSAAESFVHDHLSPYISRSAGDLLGEHYAAVTSRGGLVLLRRRHISDDELLLNLTLCVYDPVTGERTFLPYPTDVDPIRGMDTCVLLTAADGIGCSFLLFLPYLDLKLDADGGGYTATVLVQTASSSTDGTWAPAVSSHDCTGHGFSLWRRRAVVLQGGVIHWLVRRRGEIVTYNSRTTEPGRVKLPAAAIGFKGRLHLGSYYDDDAHDGRKLLRLFGAHRFKISVWRQLSSGGGGGDWAAEATVIDTEEKLRSLHPDILVPPDCRVRIEFRCSGEGSDVVLLHVNLYSVEHPAATRILVVLLDLETKEMRLQNSSASSALCLEIDLRSRLQDMKIFS